MDPLFEFIRVFNTKPKQVNMLFMFFSCGFRDFRGVTVNVDDFLPGEWWWVRYSRSSLEEWHHQTSMGRDHCGEDPFDRSKHLLRQRRGPGVECGGMGEGWWGLGVQPFRGKGLGVWKFGGFWSSLLLLVAVDFSARGGGSLQKYSGRWMLMLYLKGI